MVTYTYPIIILSADFSSKIFHYPITTSFTSNMQGSHLVERKKLQQYKPEDD